MKMAYPMTNLIFEGGGVKGIAYVGALQKLDEKGVLPNVKRVGGTSAGAIMALLCGLNYSLSEIETILKGLDFNKFLDSSWGILRDAERLIKDFGWYKGDYFREWVGEIIKNKTGNSDATFEFVNGLAASQGFKEMYFVGTNLSTRFSEVFSAEHTPRTCIADAVRISMSIPLFFAAKRNVRDDVYVDGGLLDNYPVKLFDRQKYVAQYATEPDYYKEHNEMLKKQGIEVSPYLYNQETLGFRLDSGREIAVFRDQAEPAHNKIDDFFSYAWGIVETITESQQNQHLHSDDWHRTIYIDTLGVKTTDFGLSDEKKNELVQSGAAGAQKYFEWYDQAQTVCNRP
ncbi:patatin-like phospholipase family protein [Azotosporobacter soli]|uniref:patatin-like phospholipase family protein n=1 Tax=Azotosporobacter soli TaxID=3055040 RepID=UPI0031FE96FD